MSLLKLWERLRRNEDFPQFGALTSDDISRSVDKLSFSEVVEGERLPRFRIIREGSQFERIYRISRVGTFLDEALSPALRDRALNYYEYVVAARRPSFSFSIVRKGDGPAIRYERLLLPFADNGSQVRFIVCMITLFSEENGFDASDVTTGRLESNDE